ncbi:MAG: antibiotic biosynthesis monooxygenase [Burkholderiaceae bacterium]|nr:antibiotic biosynthesis monooxygenase [Burkholderiaceae bacterium]
MAHFISVLTLRSAAGRLDEAIAQFTQGRVLETCRDAVPGFISGRLLRSHDDENQACVICEWADRDAFEQWMSSPRRGGGPNRIFEPAGRSALFEVVQELYR